MFLKEFFKTVNADDNKCIENYPDCKDLNNVLKFLFSLSLMKVYINCQMFNVCKLGMGIAKKSVSRYGITVTRYVS